MNAKSRNDGVNSKVVDNGLLYNMNEILRPVLEKILKKLVFGKSLVKKGDFFGDTATFFGKRIYEKGSNSSHFKGRFIYKL